MQPANIYNAKLHSFFVEVVRQVDILISGADEMLFAQAVRLGVVAEQQGWFLGDVLTYVQFIEQLPELDDSLRCKGECHILIVF